MWYCVQSLKPYLMRHTSQTREFLGEVNVDSGMAN